MQPTNLKRRAIVIAIHAACGAMIGISPLAHAGPTGGQVVGGTGTISQSSTNTTINQSSQSMAINWQSYNVNRDERVQYIQPNSSSISLNRILSNNGSVIAGRIDANGKVILVNPNGLFFTPSAVLNVGSLIASGLDINPTDFMNGKYVFQDIPGTSGTVVNQGLINASLGGNAALIGKQVKNEGQIVANLGTVTLAAGKEAVLTFDNDGILGVRISKEILQNELGVDPAVINNGTIEAHGGKVLLTASQSQDIFSRAVNTTGIEEAKSVVVHDDGSFTLGDGADVLNTGTIDISTQTLYQNSGRIVLIGENVTSSGTLKADARNGNAGDIELHAKDTTLLTQNSNISARAEVNGLGGTVKVLGDKVGLFDQATIDVSGSNGGGQALIGGDFQGKNQNIRNASVTLVDRNTSIYADATQNGDGGKVILWADGITKFLGNIFARGGAVSGDGGFVETSGKQDLWFDGYTDRSAANGASGILLLDPDNIDIRNCGGGGGSPSCSTDAFNQTSNPTTYTLAFGSGSNNYVLSPAALRNNLSNGDVVLQARSDITVTSAVSDPGNTAAHTLTMQAGDDIFVNNSLNLGVNNLILISGSAGCGNSCGGGGSRNISIFSPIRTSGTITLLAADNVNINNAIGTAGTTSNNPSSLTVRAGNDIIMGQQTSGGVTTFGSITTNGAVSLTAADASLTTGPAPITVAPNGTVNGDISLDGNIATNGGDFTATTVAGYFDNWFVDPSPSLNAGSGNISIITGGAETFDSFLGGAFLGDMTAGNLSVMTSAGGIRQSTNSLRNLDIAGTATFNAGTNAITLLNQSNDIRGDINIATTGAVQLENLAPTTRLGTVSAGSLMVNADNSLTVAGNVTTTGATDLNFGFFGGSTFTVDPALSLSTGALTINGGTGADTFNIGTSLFGTVNGNDGSDTFNITAAGVSIANLYGGSLGNSGTGTDTLVGNNGINAWQITSADGGALNTNITFSGIEAVTGGTDIDAFTFTFDPTAAFSTQISGGGQGAGASDTVTFSGPTSITVPLARFADIESITGINDGSAGNGLGNPSTLIGLDVANNWNISGTNSGTYNTGLTFTGFNNLTGGSADDTFTIGSTGAITGALSGGGHVLGDRLVARQGVANVWGFTSTTSGSLAQVGAPNTTYVNNFADIETYTSGGTNADWADFSGILNASVNAGSFTGFAGVAGGANSTLIGADNQTNNWNIQSVQDSSGVATDGLNDGTVNGLRFINFSNLTGGNATDNFVIAGSGFFNGQIQGGGGTDSLTGKDVANTWNILASNSTLTYLGPAPTPPAPPTNVVTTFNGVENITGGSVADTFTLANGGALNGVINGGTGADSLTITAPGNQTVELGNRTTANLNVYQVEAITANAAAVNTLVGDNTTNTWTINGTNAGNVSDGTITTSFANFANVTGGSNADAFTLALGGSVSGVLAGAGGSDSLTITAPGNQTVELGNRTTANLNVYQVEAITANAAAVNTLIGDNTTNTWTINGTNAGSVSDGTTTTSFASFANVTGGSANDTFVFSAISNLTGALNGGAGADTVDMTARTGALTVTLGASGISNVEQITGNTDANTVLIGDNTTNTWTINGTNAGNVSDGTTTTSFASFANVTGGSANDTFAFSAISNLTGSLNGNAGADTVNMTARTGPLTVTLGASGISNVEQITGNTDANTVLVGDNTTNTWTINGTNAGSVSDGTTTTSFASFANVTGGSVADTFTLANGGALNGVINGGTGADSLTITAPGNQTVELGNRTTANLNVYQVEAITANAAAVNTLVGDNTTNTWTINGTNAGNVSDGTITTSFANFANVTGGGAADTVSVTDAGSLGTLDGGNDNDIFTVTGTITTLNGGAGDDTVTIASGTNASGNVTTVNLGAGDDQFVINAGNATTVNGDAGNDTFTVNGGTVDTIDGGTDNDAVTYTQPNVSVTVGDNIGLLGVTVRSIEGVNATNGILSARNNVTTTWIINDVNAGQVSDSGGESLVFRGFATLNGGTGDDNFSITRNAAGTTNGRITGTINGNGGTNTLTVSLTGNEVGQVSYVGSTGTDAVTINGASGTYNGIYTPVATTTGADQLQYTSATGARYTVDYQGVDTVQTSRSLATLTVNGTGADDTLTLGNGTFAVSNAAIGNRTPVNYTNVASLIVNGQAGSDIVNLDNVNLSGNTLTLAAEQVNGTGTQTVGTLILDGVGQFGTAGNQIGTDLDTLRLTGTVGDVHINEQNNLTLETQGNVTNRGQFTIAGNATFNTGQGGSLTLDNAANDFNTVATQSGVAAAALSLTDANNIAGGNLTAAAITLNTQTGIGSGDPGNYTVFSQRLQTQTANLTITNVSGGVYVGNDQALTASITNGDHIHLTNGAGLIVERLYTNGGALDPRPYAGSIFLDVTGPVTAYTGLGSRSPTSAPDIIAENLFVNARDTFGIPGRPMSLRVNNTFTLLGARGYVFYFGGRPADITNPQDLVVFSGLTNLTNQQLIELESLEDIDPAIFTQVRNYYHEDVAILMPEDQRIDEEEEKEGEGEQNRSEHEESGVGGTAASPARLNP